MLSDNTLRSIHLIFLILIFAPIILLLYYLNINNILKIVIAFSYLVFLYIYDTTLIQIYNKKL